LIQFLKNKFDNFRFSKYGTAFLIVKKVALTFVSNILSHEFSSIL